jgi:hypothetical protein
MTQQSYAAAQRRRTIATVGMVGVVLIGAGLAAFSGPGTKEVSPEPPAPAAKPAPPPKPAATEPTKPKREKRKREEKPLIDEKVLWEDPPEWKRLPRSGMRYASYEIPAAKGDSRIGELNVFILSGDVESNIQRWVAEFSKFDLKTVVRKTQTVNGMPQHIVEIPNGHFSGGMGDTKASDNYGLLGAIILAPSGAEYFFKLTGPAKVVKAARKPFYKMLDSMRLEKPPANLGAGGAGGSGGAAAAPGAGGASGAAVAPAATPTEPAPAAAAPAAPAAGGAPGQ